MFNAVQANIVLDFIAGGDGDSAGFLADDKGDTVRFFRDADAGAMARAEKAQQLRIHGEREKAGGRGGAIALNDNGAIMHGGAGIKDRQQEVSRDPGVQRDAAFDKRPQADFAFDDNQGANLLVRKLLERQEQFFNGFAAMETASEADDAALPDPGQEAANLALEHDDHAEGGIRSECGQYGSEHLQLGVHRAKIDHDEYEEAGENGGGAPAADNDDELVDDERGNQNIERRGPGETGHSRQN